MSRFAQVALALALVLPLAAYVLGTVMAAEPAPADHQPIILQQTSEPTPSPKPPRTKKPKPSPGQDDGDDDEPEVVEPRYVEQDDDDWDDDDDDWDDDDD